MLTNISGSHARLRGEIVHIAHIERVPRHRNLLGEVVPASFRATVVFETGQWSNNVSVHELAPVETP